MDRLVLLGVVLGSLGVACGSSDDRSEPAPLTVAPPTRSVCSDCPAWAGGESSDFGGTPHACAHFEQPVAIDSSQVDELGFDLGNLEQLIERDIFGTLHWVARDTPGGEPATGYSTGGLLIGVVRISDQHRYIKLDPTRCTGNTCSSEELGEWNCSDRLELGVDGSFRTADDTLSAFVSGYVLKGRDGFPFDETPAGTLFAGLRDVEGTLKFFPDPNLSIKAALFWVGLRFESNFTEGELGVRFTLEEGSGTSLEYEPLLGSWPYTPPRPEREPGLGGPTQ